MSQSSGTIESTEKKPQKTGGLAGITAGQTAISTVGKEGKGLTYRGYSIEDLASQASFEEVAFLLLNGHLPNRSELSDFNRKLMSQRDLPPALQATLRSIPAT
ncbi:MAG: citrate/2-methylcitrate synthase, partial [Planctomycetota bacterium]